jgi:hypothetical protein
MFAKLFTAGNGKIPFIQIILGVIIGAVGMLVYAKFYKPKLLFPESQSLPRRTAADIPTGREKTAAQAGKETDTRGKASGASASAQTGYEGHGHLVGAPVMLDLGSLQVGHAPELPIPAAFEQIEELDEDEDEDDDDKYDDNPSDEEDESLIRNP